MHTVGKVGQLFDGQGIDVQHPGATNARALDETDALMSELEAGFVFTNRIETDRLLLRQYAPPGVLVNEALEVLQFRGQTTPYLALPVGDPIVVPFGP